MRGYIYILLLLHMHNNRTDKDGCNVLKYLFVPQFVYYVASIYVILLCFQYLFSPLCIYCTFIRQVYNKNLQKHTLLFVLAQL